MSTENLVLIGVLFIITVLLYIVQSSVGKLNDSVNSDLVLSLVNTAVDAALQSAAAYAAKTPTPIDDEQVKALKALWDEWSSRPADTPPIPPATPPGAMVTGETAHLLG